MVNVKEIFGVIFAVFLALALVIPITGALENVGEYDYEDTLIDNETEVLEGELPEDYELEEYPVIEDTVQVYLNGDEHGEDYWEVDYDEEDETVVTLTDNYDGYAVEEVVTAEYTADTPTTSDTLLTTLTPLFLVLAIISFAGYYAYKQVKGF